MRSLLVLLLLVGAAWPRSLPHYDLDSLVWQSRYVVEVEYLGERRARVVRSFLGDLEAGATVPCPEYRVFGRDWELVPLGPKPRLLLFLDEKKHGVSSGAWLVRDERVHRPIQVNNPGGYKWLVTDAAPRIDAFRDALPARIEAAKRLQRRLGREPVAEDAPALLALLRERAGIDDEELRHYDVVAEAAAQRLVTLHDLDALAVMLQLPLGWRALDTLAHGFATPAGRDDLLRRIGDESIEPARRVKWAAYVEDVAPRPWELPKLPKADARYFTRVAALALSLAVHEELCATLCRQVRQGVGSSPARQADVRAAIPVLTRLHGDSRSEWARFEAAAALARIDPSAYAALDSPAGPALGRLSPPRFLDGRMRIEFRYEYHSHAPYDRSVVVLARDGREVEFEMRLRLRGEWTSMSSGLILAVPPSVPAGRYRAFIRLYRDGKCVSRSYGCDVDLP